MLITIVGHTLFDCLGLFSFPLSLHGVVALFLWHFASVWFALRLASRTGIRLWSQMMTMAIRWYYLEQKYSLCCVETVEEALFEGLRPKL